jgi:hypothetical protein
LTAPWPGVAWLLGGGTPRRHERRTGLAPLACVAALTSRSSLVSAAPGRRGFVRGPLTLHRPRAPCRVHRVRGRRARPLDGGTQPAHLQDRRPARLPAPARTPQSTPPRGRHGYAGRHRPGTPTARSRSPASRTPPSCDDPSRGSSSTPRGTGSVSSCEQVHVARDRGPTAAEPFGRGAATPSLRPRTTCTARPGCETGSRCADRDV